MTIFNESTQGGVNITGNCRNKTIYKIRAKKGGVKIRGKYRIYMSMVLCPPSISKNLFSTSQKTILEQIMNEGYTLRLFKNDEKPSIYSNFGSFVEANFEGYTSKNLGDWTFGAKSACVGEAKHSKVEWEYMSCTAVTVYGYYVTNSDDQLLFSQNFGSKTLKCSTLTLEVKTDLYSEA